MTSWRDDASQQAQDDLDGLVGAALPFAEEMLDQRGEFFPYALALDEAGEARVVAGDPGGGEQPASLDVLATLIEGLRLEKDSLRAVALVSDVRLPESDAVRVELEHREGHALAVFLPYKKKRMRRGVEVLGHDCGSKRAAGVGIAAGLGLAIAAICIASR
ncbi:MAG: hypothetical protein ACOYXM_00915 [Actinomycetota bacterium]